MHQSQRLGSMAESFAHGGGTSREVRDVEVSSVSPRRRLTAADKCCVWAAAEACTAPGQVGALWRREGLSSSHLPTWRRPREHGILEALTPHKRGRKARGLDPLAQRVAPRERDQARLRQQRQQAEPISAVPQKVSALLERSHAGNPPGGSRSWPPRGDERRTWAPGRPVRRWAGRAPAPTVTSQVRRACVARASGRPHRSPWRARNRRWCWPAGPLSVLWIRPRRRYMPPSWMKGSPTPPSGPWTACGHGMARSASAEGSGGGYMTASQRCWPLAPPRWGRGISRS
jgi:hypothetical protein